MVSGSSNLHEPPYSGARSLALCLKLPLAPYTCTVCMNSEGSGNHKYPSIRTSQENAVIILKSEQFGFCQEYFSLLYHGDQFDFNVVAMVH